MDNNEGHRRAPAGTFGDLEPPSPNESDRPSGAASGSNRPGHDDQDPQRTLPLGAGSRGGDTSDPGDEPPTASRRYYPDTLKERPKPASPWSAEGDAGVSSDRPDADDDPDERPSVQSIPPPMPIGDPPDEAFDSASRTVRSRAVTPAYARISRRPGPPSTEAAQSEPSPAAQGLDAGPTPIAPAALNEGKHEPREPRINGDAFTGAAPSSSATSSHGETTNSLLPTFAPPKPARMDAQPLWGLLLVLSMTAIGVGGWFATSGTYRDKSTIPAAVASPPGPSSAATGQALAPHPQPALAPNASPPKVPAESQPPTSATTSTARLGTRKKVDAVLSDTPSRDEVRAALLPLHAALDQCAQGRSGVAQLDITVANTGSVTNAVVGGDFAGSAEGSCMARVARTARFSQFKKPRFRIIYPFSL